MGGGGSSGRGLSTPDDVPATGVARYRHRSAAVVGRRRLPGRRRSRRRTRRLLWWWRGWWRRSERSRRWRGRRLGRGHHRHGLRQGRQRHRLGRWRFRWRLGGGDGDRPARGGRRHPRAAGRRGADHRGHDRAVRVAVRQAVTAHDVVTAGDQVRKPGVRAHTGVDHGHLHAGATAELPRLLQIQHVHVLRLQPEICAGQHPDLGAVGILLHRRQRPGRGVRRHRARIDRRRRNRIGGR